MEHSLLYFVQDNQTLCPLFWLCLCFGHVMKNSSSTHSYKLTHKISCISLKGIKIFLRTFHSHVFLITCQQMLHLPCTQLFKMSYLLIIENHFMHFWTISSKVELSSRLIQPHLNSTLQFFTNENEEAESP